MPYLHKGKILDNGIVDIDLEADLNFEKQLDRKDLLYGVDPLLKFVIKKFAAKPAYFGNLASVILKLNNTEQR